MLGNSGSDAFGVGDSLGDGISTTIVLLNTKGVVPSVIGNIIDLRVFITLLTSSVEVSDMTNATIDGDTGIGLGLWVYHIHTPVPAITTKKPSSNIKLHILTSS